MKKNRTIVLLVALVIAQFVVWAVIDSRSPDRPPGLVVGDDVSSVVTLGADGTERPLTAEGPSLLLVFHSECGHCRRVAPDWRRWIEEHGTELRVIAISKEEREPAVAYAREHGWEVEVRTVEVGLLGGREHALTARTPWLFALDGAGIVIGEGHGSRIDELGALVRDRQGAEG